jgi:hypothetical protein
MNPVSQALLCAVLCTAGAGCLAGDGTGMPMPGPCDPAVDPQASLTCDVQPIFTANCALSGCHAGTSPQQGMNLSAGQAFGNTVNVPSMELPSMDRVEPFQPDASYLVHKIQGSQATVGGTGDRMPLNAPPLTAAQIDTIRSWISAGALDN